MSTVMYIKASPRVDRSHSRGVARAFISALKESDPGVEVLERDLFDIDLPVLDNLTLNGKYNIIHGRDFTEQEQQAWSAVEAVIDDFKSADRYVFAVPMWNFSLPYRLKHYIDVLTQPGSTFTVGPDGYKGLLENKKAFIAYASGGDYQDVGNPLENWDFQSTYMKVWLSFIGITDVFEVGARGMFTDGGARSKEVAIAQAEKMVADF